MSTEKNQPEDLGGIAIVGMSGRFPGAKNVEELWSNLINGVETISRFREDELEYSVAAHTEQSGDHKFVRARGVLENVDMFDAEFFGISPREAEVMDPQHRLFLECAWESLESAGYDPANYRGLIGVYAGSSVNTYLLYHICRDRKFAASHAADFQVGSYSVMLGNDAHFLATRASYKLDLKGPSMSIQTACSTSLVAVSQACISLQTFQCDMALAGGVSISFPQKRDYLYQEGSLVSGDGKCRTFDASADGTVFGHGVAVVALKRLEDAVADHDNILAVIKGVAVNNDGSAKVSYAAPSVEAQAGVIAQAQALAGVGPDSISYIEAHGTGTPLGDPIEIAALTKAFREGGSSRTGFCPIGTAKTQIGHLDTAAGATGLIKTVLQLQHEKIPAILNFESPNPKIDFANSPFFPVSKTLDWKRGAAPRRAGVSSFGVGGTNAHVVVEEAPLLAAQSGGRQQQLFVLSAKSDAAVKQMAINLAAYLEKHPEESLASVAFTLAKGRRKFAHRMAVAGSTVEEMTRKLRDSKTAVTNGGASAPTVVFLFPGQGAQYVDMGSNLYESEPVFRAEVDRCAELLRKNLDVDIRKILFPDAAGRIEAEKAINQTYITQPAIFVIEYALAKLWMSWGVRPSVLIGHSIGEYVAAVLAETFTLEDALALLAARARLMSKLPGGAMLAVRSPGEKVEPLLQSEMSLAAYNSPNLCTISGPTEILEGFKQKLEANGIASVFLATSHAFHSDMMEPMLPEFIEMARRTPARAPRIPWISTCTGKWMTPEDIADAGYWARQLRQPVRFVDALGRLADDSLRVFLEVGPGQTLMQLVLQRRDKRFSKTISTLGPSTAPGIDLNFMLTTLGRLWSDGVVPDWDAFFGNENCRRVPLPTYPFERKSYWVTPPSAEVMAESPDKQPATLEEAIHAQLRTMEEQLNALAGTRV